MSKPSTAKTTEKNESVTCEITSTLGIIEIDFSGKLVLGVTMSEMIKKPGNVPYLAFGNIVFKMGITTVALPTLGKSFVYLFIL